MKRLISIILIFAMLFCTFALTACDSEGDDSGSSKSESSSASSTSSESEGESEIDPADRVNPDAPENETLTLFEDEQSDYVIVYDKSDSAISAVAEALAMHVQEKYSIILETRDESEPEALHEIIIGNVRENARFVVDKLYETNDFAISVCGDDLVLYATSERLYDYMLAVAKKRLDGEKYTFAPDNSFIYHKSSYKDVPYAGYLNRSYGVTSFDSLKGLFEARTFTASDGTKLNYRIYIPSSYYEGAELPVVTFLHGAGERGSDNESQLKNMLPKLFSHGSSPYWNAIIIAPQCPSGNQWVDTPWANGNYSTDTVKESNELKAVVELINQQKAELSTDENRYYIMGISMGGFGTWDMIMRHGDMFAGAMPICGGADTSQASALVDIPIYTFHGTADGIVPYEGTYDMVNAIKDACAEAGKTEVIKFGSMSGGSHTIWDAIAANAVYSKWLFNQSLENRNK